MAPIMAIASVKPSAIPVASASAGQIRFFEANASWRPRIRQLTTINEMKAPSCLCASGISAARMKSTEVTKVAMITM